MDINTGCDTMPVTMVTHWSYKRKCRSQQYLKVRRLHIVDIY